ncbi:CR6-interacting factor [Daphnia magna]|uniref:Large ribosomal subunit protein mL64 n=1 Tax=Daphnia magna TaxID=35525 RepID=A0A0P4Y3L9_9CRUS|nr:CR6-interacting factor [Daphnia magna]
MKCKNSRNCNYTKKFETACYSKYLCKCNFTPPGERFVKRTFSSASNIYVANQIRPSVQKNKVKEMANITRALHTSFTKSIGISKTMSKILSIPFNRFASTDISSTTELAEQEVLNEKQLAAAALEAKRNKSRLKPRHYKILHGQMQVDPQNPEFPYEKTVKFRRKLIAQHGLATGINLGIAWSTKEELQEKTEYEKVAHPFTIQQIVEQKKKLREEEMKKIETRQKDIELKMGKLALWMKELKDRQEKKEAVVRAAQEKKDILIEEVRQHFGYVVSMKDPKFQEMMEQKEKEAKKAGKEMKKKVRVEKATSKALAQAEAVSTGKEIKME